MPQCPSGTSVPPRTAQNLTLRSLQEPTSITQEQWPHALHLLAHVYAGRL